MSADLIITEGDCTLYGKCSCGTAVGEIRPHQSLDVLGQAWERHVMTVCSIGPYDPEATQ